MSREENNSKVAESEQVLRNFNCFSSWGPLQILPASHIGVSEFGILDENVSKLSQCFQPSGRTSVLPLKNFKNNQIVCFHWRGPEKIYSKEECDWLRNSTSVF